MPFVDKRYTTIKSCCLEYRDVFYMFDRDNNGYITTKELNTIMKTLGFNPTEEDLQQMIFTVDYDGE